ncbi:hypothetical protein SVIO_088140 [Streptomyces violaceusniger]|uniref:Uncharacterized protein n=1 Tax=Streptomyces violaceusniger TaxID=68280 RepID=A0A4D4L9D4_STRVO|nr:hypothetical protein SVIO_088140 [Streptomyces violaceusniger]
MVEGEGLVVWLVGVDEVVEGGGGLAEGGDVFLVDEGDEVVGERVVWWLGMMRVWPWRRAPRISQTEKSKA